MYLPKDWCDDPARCQQAGIPETERTIKTKLELAWEIIDHQVSNGVSFDFIGADGYYGNDAEFASVIDSLGYLYMLDIHSDQPIYLERPELIVPERKSTRGAVPDRGANARENFQLTLTTTTRYKCVIYKTIQSVRVEIIK